MIGRLHILIGLDMYGDVPWVFITLAVLAAAGIAGIAVMAFSITALHQKKPKMSRSLILAIMGTMLLLPIMFAGIIFIISFIEVLFDGFVWWQYIPLAVLAIAIPVCVIVYDVKIIKKFVRSRKAAIPDDEQGGH